MSGENSEKQELPDALKELGEKAIARHEQRPATPRLKMTTEDGKWWFDSPYREEDEDHWVALMFDAFGTRSQATFRCFMIQLSQLCSSDWDKQSEAWHPDEDELMAAVQIVRSTKPRNEAEACLAAQMVAIHVMQMKLSAQALKHGWMEPRTCAVAGKLARTYALLMETMAKLKRKGSKQHITVKKFAQHEHKHIHLHPGDLESSDRPYEPKTACENNQTAIGQPTECAPLLGPHTERHELPMSCGHRQDAVPNPRGS